MASYQSVETLIQTPPSGLPSPAAPAAAERRVVRVLPWLLITSGRMTPSELTLLASQQGLCRLLDLSLSLAGGALAVKGQAQAQEPAGALLAAAASLHR